MARRAKKRFTRVRECKNCGSSKRTSNYRNPYFCESCLKTIGRVNILVPTTEPKSLRLWEAIGYFILGGWVGWLISYFYKYAIHCWW